MREKPVSILLVSLCESEIIQYCFRVLTQAFKADSRARRCHSSFGACFNSQCLPYNRPSRMSCLFVTQSFVWSTCIAFQIILRSVWGQAVVHSTSPALQVFLFVSDQCRCLIDTRGNVNPRKLLLPVFPSLRKNKIKKKRIPGCDFLRVAVCNII